MTGQRVEMTVDLRTAGAEASAERLGAAVDGALGAKESRRDLADVQKQIEGIATEIERGGGRGARAFGEQLREAIEGARRAVGQLDADNQAMSDRLLDKLKEAKASRQTAWEARDDAGFGNACQTVAAIESELRARASLNEELGKQQEALTSLTAELERATGAEVETASGSGSLRRELREITLSLAEMERAGLRGSAAYEALRQRGAELTDSLGDARAQMRILAHDNSGLQGVISGVQGLSGAMTAAVGVTALFGQQSENLQKVMVKLQAVMSISMGLQQTLNALNKDSALRLGVVGRLTEWWAACKAKAAAAATTETAAIQGGVAAQSASVATTTAAGVATTTATTANIAHAASWRAVGVAVKSVPVFGWILVAVTAVIAVIGVWLNRLDESKKKYKWLGEAIKSTNAEYVKERNNLERLYKIATDVNRSLQDRLVAINRLKQQYPDYFGKLSNEAILAGQAADEYKRLAENIQKAAIARGMEKTIEKEGEKIADWYADHAQEADWLNQNRSKYQQLKKKYTKEYIKNLPKGHAINYGGGDSVTYYKNREDQEAIDFIFMYEGRHKSYHNDFKNDNEEANKKIKFLSDQLSSKYKGQALSDATDEEKRAATPGDPLYYQRQMDEYLSKANDHRLSEAERKKYQNKYREAERKYKAAYWDPNKKGIGLSAAGNADIAEQVVDDLDDKGWRDRIRKLAGYAREAEQAKIDAMEDGAEKRARQRALDDEREFADNKNKMNDDILAEIERQKKLWDAQEAAAEKSAKAKGKQYRKKAFDPGDLYSSEFDAGGKIADKKNNSGEKVAIGNVSTKEIDEILKHYGVIEDQIVKKQLNRISQMSQEERLAMAEYLRDYGTLEEKKTAIAAIYSAKRAKAESDAERMRLAQEERKEVANVDFEDFMSNRAALAFGEIEKLSRETIGRLIEEMEKYRGEVTRTFDPEKIEKYNQALTKLRKAQAQSQGGLLGGLLKPEWFRERAAAQAELNEAERTHGELVKQVWLARFKELNLMVKLINAVKNLTGVELTSAQAMDGSTVSGLIERLLGEGNTAGAEQLRGLLDGLGKARVELGAAEGAADKAALSVEKLKEGFEAKFGGQKGTLGKIGAIIGGIDQAVQAANETIRELAGTADALGADTSEGSGWDKATTLMEGFAGASAGAKEAFESLIALNPMGVISGLTKSFTSWIKAFAKLHDNSLERKIKQLEEQVEELERMNKRLEHRSEGEYSRKLSATYEEEARNLEKQRRLIEQQLLAEREKKDPDKDRLKGWEDELEELGWKIEELRDKALDAILGEDISATIDNFADKLSEAWGRTGDRARATKDLVRTMLRQMVQEAMKTDLTEPIRKLREMMAAALDDGTVSSAEERELEQFAQALAEETERKYRWADRIMGNETASQSGATSGSYATASQESVDEVRGRLAAIHTSGELRRRELQGLRLDIGALMEQREQSGSTLGEMRGLLFMAAGYLERIARNTDRLEEMNERLESIERNTKRI